MSLEPLRFVADGGVVLGARYELQATVREVGWRTLGNFTFAHGAFIAAGAYIAWQISSADASGLGYLAGALGSVVGMFFIGVICYALLVKPFERQPNLVLWSVITTLTGATILDSPIAIVRGVLSTHLSPAPDGASLF